MPGFERSEQSIVVQPMRLLTSKLLKSSFQFLPGASIESGGDLFQQLKLERKNGVVIDHVFREGATRHVAWLEQAVLDQSVGAD